MTKSTLPYRLLAPGPVPVPPTVLRAMGEKVLHHRTPQFIAILNDVWARLKLVFATRQPVIIITGTGSSGMEAAVVNSLSPGDEALVVVSGKFGERWAEMCERFGAKTHRLNVEWGHPVSLEKFAEALRTHPKIKTVFTQACETSTTTLHPVRQMAVLVRAHTPEALFAVDAITAVGCMPLPMDEWDLDIVVGGSQKAFMIPAGLSFVALSERAWKAQANAKMAKFYLDLASEKKINAKGDSQFSIPTPLVVGLGLVLEKINQETPEKLWRRCAALAEATRSTGEALGLKVFSQAPAPSVTALCTPSDSAELRDWLEREKNITVMGGQDHLKGKILRIGHMGDVRNEDMIALFQALGEKLGKPLQISELERQLQLAEALFS